MLFEPNFLNIEFLFNVVFRFLVWLAGLIYEFLKLLGSEEVTYVKIGLIVLSFVLFVGAIYARMGYLRIIRSEEETYGKLQFSALEEQDLEDRNVRWQKVLEYIDSPHESDWRLAIIEADNMLLDVLEHGGYVGDTIGDKLKSATTGDFRTYSKSWEAHKVRNRIAHEGINFSLSKREAERVIDLYREVFEEFLYI